MRNIFTPLKFNMGLSVILFLFVAMSCTEDAQPDELVGSWEYVESRGGLIQAPPADPNNPRLLVFRSDGTVVRVVNDQLQQVWEWEVKPRNYALHLYYRFDWMNEYQLQNRVFFVENDEIIIEPYFGKNTDCQDCATVKYRRRPLD